MATATEAAVAAAAGTAAERGATTRRRAARTVAGFLTGFLALNTYWALGGRRGVAWVVGCDCGVPPAALWLQEAAVVAGIAVVLGRAGVWRLPVPAWALGVGAWAMTAIFAAVAVQNLVGDGRTQALLLFAPLALALAALCAVVARGGGGR